MRLDTSFGFSGGGAPAIFFNQSVNWVIVDWKFGRAFFCVPVLEAPSP